MKNLSIVLAALLLATAIVSTSLWRDLRKERLASAALRTQQADQGGSPSSGSPAQCAAATPPASMPVAQDQTPACKADPRLTDAESAGLRMAALSAATSIFSLSGVSDRDLMKDPEFRKARLTQLRISTAYTYPGLAEELGLSDKEANQLFDLIAARSLSFAESASANRTASLSAAAQMEALQRQAAQLRDGVDGVRAQLGEAKYAQFMEYGNTRSARNQAVTLGSTLASAGQPLSDAQARALTAAMIAEQQREIQATSMPRQNPGSNPPSVSQTLEAFRNRQEEGNRRTLEAVASHLSTKQLGILQEQFEQQAASGRRTLEFARGRETPPAPPQGSTP